MLLRHLAACVAAAAIVVTLSGCPFSSGEAKSGGEAIKSGQAATRSGQSLKLKLPKVSTTLEWVGRVAPTDSALSQVASGLGAGAKRVEDIKAQLQAIAGSDDPFGRALVEATCWGLTSIAEQYRQNPNASFVATTTDSWATYLNRQVTALLPSNLATLVSGRVTQFNNAAQLASINPRAAYLYVQACALRSG
jgi:hypothetical protein